MSHIRNHAAWNWNALIQSAFTVLVIFSLSACTKTQNNADENQPQQDEPADTSSVTDQSNQLYLSAMKLVAWLDSAQSRSVKPEVLSALPDAQFQKLHTMLPDGVEIQKIAITIKNNTDLSLDITLEESTPYPYNMLYIPLDIQESVITALTVLPIPQPEELLALLRTGYTTVQSIANARTGISQDVEGTMCVKLNPVYYPTMQTVKEKLSPIYGKFGSQDIIKTLRIVEKKGNVWIPESIHITSISWEESSVRDCSPQSGYFMTQISLITDGVEEIAPVQIDATMEGWRISSPFGLGKATQIAAK